MAIALVASQRVATGSGTSVQSAALNTGATSLIVAWGFSLDGASNLTISDDSGGALTWTSKTVRNLATFASGRFFYAYGTNITSGGPKVTLTTAGSATLVNLEILQFSGTLTSGDPYDTGDVTSDASSTSGTTMTTQAYTTTQADEVIVIGAFRSGAGSCDTAGAGGFTLASCTAGYKIVSAIQTAQTASLDNSSASSNWLAMAATFKAAAGGGASTWGPSIADRWCRIVQA